MNKNQSIQVTAVGYPEPVIAWYKDAVKLCDGVTITSSKIFALGSGSYTCVVKNQHGQDSTSSEIKYVIMNPVSQMAVSGQNSQNNSRNNSLVSGFSGGMTASQISRGSQNTLISQKTSPKSTIEQNITKIEQKATISRDNLTSSLASFNSQNSVIAAKPQISKIPQSSSASRSFVTNSAYNSRDPSPVKQPTNKPVTPPKPQKNITRNSQNQQSQQNSQNSSKLRQYSVSSQASSAEASKRNSLDRQALFTPRVIPSVVTPASGFLTGKETKHSKSNPNSLENTSTLSETPQNDPWAFEINKRLESDQFSVISSARSPTEWRSMASGRSGSRHRRNSTGSVCSESTDFFSVTEGAPSTIMGESDEASTICDEFQSPMSSMTSFKSALSRNDSKGSANGRNQVLKVSDDIGTGQVQTGGGYYGMMKSFSTNLVGQMSGAAGWVTGNNSGQPIQTIHEASQEHLDSSTSANSQISIKQAQTVAQNSKITSNTTQITSKTVENTVKSTVQSTQNAKNFTISSKPTIPQKPVLTPKKASTHPTPIIEHKASKPSISKTADSLTTIVGEDIALMVLVTGWPVPQANWWFKSENRGSQPASTTGSGAFRVTDGRRHMIERLYTDQSKSSGSFILNIKAAVLNDTGTYFITVESSLGKSIAQVRLNVKEKAEKVESVKNDDDSSKNDPVNEFSKTLTRTPTKHPRTRVPQESNIRNSQINAQNHDPTARKSVNIETESVASTRSALSEVSTISAQSKISSITSSSLTTPRGSMPSGPEENCGFLDLTPNNLPYFLVPLTDVKVKHGQTAKLQCEIPSSSDLRFRWFFDGKRMVPECEKRYFVEHSGAVHKLIIPRTDKKLDDGVILLEAKNKFGQISCKCKLTIEENTGGDESDIEDLEPVEEKIAPIFVKCPEPMVQVKESERLRLGVIVEGKPIPEVQWFHHKSLINCFNEENNKKNTGKPKQNTFLGSSTRILKNAINGEQIFEINPIKLEHRGLYTCKIRNSNGHDEIKTEIIVRPKTPEIKEPPKSKKGKMFKKMYKADHEISRGTSSIIKIGSKKHQVNTSPMGRQSEEEKLKNQLVLKFVSLHDKEFKKYAINERNALLQLKHKNVVEMVDNFKTYPEKHIMVLECMDLELLDHIIIKNRVSEAQVANLLGQLQRIVNLSNN